MARACLHRLRRLLTALVTLPALLLSSGPAGAQQRPRPPREFRIDFQRYRLGNGLTVILYPDHHVPSVTVNLLFRVGSKDERPGRSGFAHLFEHLMFMGTRTVPNGDYDRLIEAAGGENDADTDEDRTSYHETGPANLLATFLYLEADRLASLDGDMTAAKLDLQREVVLNERRQSYDERPYAQVELSIAEHLFPPEHPYHHPVIGSVADLRAASVAELREFFRTFYVPANAQLVIAGDFEPEEARRLVERYFGWLPARPEPPHPQVEAPPLARSEEVTLREDVELPQLTVALSSPRAFADGDAECELLAAILGLGKASRLHRALVQERGLAQSVDAQQHGGRFAGWLQVQALAQAGRDVAELQRAVDEELVRLVESPPNDQELRRARALLQTRALQRLERASAMAEELNHYELHFGDAGELQRRLLGRYDEVRAEDLARVAKQWLGGKPRLVIRVLPTDETQAPAKGATSSKEGPGKGSPQGASGGGATRTATPAADDATKGGPRR